jgi:pimeloyl-ACP methyl ester carboxylesterase
LWFWLGLALLFSLPVGLALLLTGLYFYLRRKYLQLLVRIFQEKPLFVIPRGQPVPDAEEVRVATEDGRTLRGCYLRGSGQRRGVLLFGLEFGSNRWACVPYCEHLLAHGFDVFALEPRSQGDSDRQPGYEPLQWVTEYEVRDAAAALRYLKARPDADPRGIGFFGISKGAAAGLVAAARDPWVRCFVTDGVFATYTTLVPYMRQWFRIYNSSYVLQGLLPSWYYGLVGRAGMRQTERQRGCRFVHLEKVMPLLAPRPLLMIHGGADTYIKPDMARALFELARQPKEFWLVEGAKHNQSLHAAGAEYRRRVLDFFLQHLGEPKAYEGTNGERADSRTGYPVSPVVPPLCRSSNIPAR